MRFPQGPFRGSSPVRVRACVFAVGRRAYVACSGDGRARVALTDDTGKHALASLGDGTEVEILAWRPRARTATRYRVRSICDQSEGWLGADDLRSALQPVPPAPPGSGREDTGRKFSQGR